MKPGSKESESAKAIDFFYEAGGLKNLPRSGWRLAGIRDAESTADHSYRAAVIAYVIARMEGADAEHACALAVFHDVSEARIGELDKVMSFYLDKSIAEKKAVAQSEASSLSDGRWYPQMFAEFDQNRTPEAKAANDADILECALTGIEYSQSGFPKALDWAKSKGKLFSTKSGRALYKEALVSDSSRWWKKIWRLRGL